MCVLLLLSFRLMGCRLSSRDQITITFLDPQSSHDLSERSVLADDSLQQFTRQTGIRVQRPPAPETALDQLDLVRESLRNGTASFDVYGIDIIWPAALNEGLIDLKPYLSTELRSIDPELVANYTVGGKVVAVPYHPNIGALYYRADLLLEYGYSSPPSTWDQLEQMAVRIQRGERAKGQEDFWGFVWPGAAGEGLTCNALEWQIGEGGGRIIEADGTISVNNPSAIRSWQRAAHWVGWISPPGVTSYEEWDATEFFLSKKAAFFRGWARSRLSGSEGNEASPDWVGSSSVPAGNVARVATIGGFGLAASRSSAHLNEALRLIRFLVHNEVELEKVQAGSKSDLRQPRLYDAPNISSQYAHYDLRSDSPKSSLVARPSTTAGTKYEEVARAYIRAVHSVMIHKTGAHEAAAALQAELVRITGFGIGPPH